MIDIHSGVRHKSNKLLSILMYVLCKTLFEPLQNSLLLKVLFYIWPFWNFGKNLFVHLILTSLIENAAECVYSSEKTFPD